MILKRYIIASFEIKWQQLTIPCYAKPKIINFKGSRMTAPAIGSQTTAVSVFCILTLEYAVFQQITHHR
jgi:hypothetical protein